jgi:two-component system sensor histidine kinase KdpD
VKTINKPNRFISLNRPGYLWGSGLVIVSTILGLFLFDLLAPTTIVMLYLLCVVVAAIFWRVGPAILVSLLSVLFYNFFFIPPRFTFIVPDWQSFLILIVLLIVGIIVSYLASNVRQQTEIARSRERQTAALYTLCRDLVLSNDLKAYIHAIISRIKDTFGRDTVIFLAEAQNDVLLKPFKENMALTVDEKDIAEAAWCFQHVTIVGRGTDMLPESKARYLPLVTTRGTVGVLALWNLDNLPELTDQQKLLLGAYADLSAVAIENIQLSEQAKNVEMLKDREKLQVALFNSISHDLRTPLSSIIGVISSLQDESMEFDRTARKNLLEIGQEEADRLNHLITNLLDMSRIEAGAVKISGQPVDVEDMIGVALEQLGRRTIGRQINTHLDPELPFVSVDFGLIVQTLVNVLDNAIKYSPIDSTIEVTAYKLEHEVVLEVADRGSGIPSSDLPHVFDKFYRVHRPDDVPGTGLGLPICKGFVEVHNGRIWAENRQGGGTIITLALPLSLLQEVKDNGYYQN